MKPSPSQFTDIDRALLVEQHRSYVRVLAVEVAKGLPPHIELDELIACGNLGLVEAAERYEPRMSESERERLQAQWLRAVERAKGWAE